MARPKKTGAAKAPGKKRGARKAKKGVAEGAVEVRKASDTQEAMALPPADMADHHRKQILGYLDKKETANSHYRTALKSAQKDGIDTEAMLSALGT